MPVQVVQQLMGRGGQVAPLGGDEVEGALRRRVGQAQHPDVGKQAQVQLRRAGGDDAPAPAAGGQRLRQLGRVGVEQRAGVDTEPVVVPLGDLRLAVDEDLVLRVEGGGTTGSARAMSSGTTRKKASRNRGWISICRS